METVRTNIILKNVNIGTVFEWLNQNDILQLKIYSMTQTFWNNFWPVLTPALVYKCICPLKGLLFPSFFCILRDPRPSFHIVNDPDLPL